MNMTQPLPQCECLNECGDDPGVAAGTASPCKHSVDNQAERFDNQTIEQFGCALRGKLREARAKGRSGWHDKFLCSQQTLSDMLRAHVDKGDPRDVAAFAMFLWARSENIVPAAEAEPAAFIIRSARNPKERGMVIAADQVGSYLRPALTQQPLYAQLAQAQEDARGEALSDEMLQTIYAQFIAQHPEKTAQFSAFNWFMAGATISDAARAARGGVRCHDADACAMGQIPCPTPSACVVMPATSAPRGDLK